MLLVILGFIGVLAAFFIAKGFVIINQAEAMVVERLGKYSKTFSSGMNLIWPIIDRPQVITWKYTEETDEGDVITRRKKVSRIDLRETVYDFPEQNVITKDNVVIEIDAILYFQITNPKQAVYEIANLPDAIEKLTQTTLRNVIGEMELDETLSSRDRINKRLRTIIDEAAQKWGVQVNMVELQDIIPPDNIKEAMEKQMRAERNKRAAILEAEGIKRSKILEAEAESETRVKMAEADARAITSIKKSTLTTQGNPVEYMIIMRYIETLKEMVSGKDNKVVYMPYESADILGSLGSIREILEGMTAAAPGKKDE